MVPTPFPRDHDAREKETAASESCVKLYLAGGFAHYSDLVAPWQLRAQTSMWPRVTLLGQVAIPWAGDFLGSRQDGWAWGGLVAAPPTLPAPTSPPPSGSSAAFGKESKGLLGYLGGSRV